MLGTTIAGMIIEPIQAEGGDNHASPSFFRDLRRMSAEYDTTSTLLWQLRHWFGAMSRAFLSSTPPRTRRVACSTSCHNNHP